MSQFLRIVVALDEIPNYNVENWIIAKSKTLYFWYFKRGMILSSFTFCIKMLNIRLGFKTTKLRNYDVHNAFM